MRNLFERLIAALPMHPRCRRALDETLADWKHEDETLDRRVERWLCGLRSAASVLRALVMMSWWSPRTPLSQPLRMAGTSARDEIIDLINNLSPDSSYEDILREVAARRAKQESGEGSPAPQAQSVRLKPDATTVVVSAFRRTLKIAAVFIVVSLAGGLVQTYSTTPTYESTAMVRVQPDVPSMITVQGPRYKTPGVSDPDQFMQTELNVLQSRDLMRKVVRALRLDRDSEFTAAPGVPAGAPSVGTNTDQTETSAERAAIETMSANLSVSVVRVSYLFSIRFSSSNAAKAALVANTLAQEYEKQNLERRRADITARLTKISEYVTRLSAEIEANQRNLIVRTTEANILDPAQVTGETQRARGVLNVKTAALQEAQGKLNEMQRLDPEKDLDAALKHPDIQRLGSISQLRSTLTGYKSEKAQNDANAFGPEHPRQKDVDRRIAQAEDVLRNEVRAQIDSARTAYRQAAQAANAAKLIYEAQQRLMIENSKAGIPYQQLRTRVTSDQITLQEMWKQQKDLEILAQGVDNNVSIVEFAQPASRPYKPNPARNLLIWLTLGLTASAAIILLRGRALPAEVGFA